MPNSARMQMSNNTYQGRGVAKKKTYVHRAYSTNILLTGSSIKDLREMFNAGAGDEEMDEGA